MARMHSRKKGKSGSKRPLRKTVPSWIRYKPKEVELIITKLAKEGKTSSETGMILRDIYGIPDIKKLMKKSVTGILKEKKIKHEIPEDLFSLIKRSISIKKHLEENHKDEVGKRGLILTESKIRRLAKYYKKTKKIPVDWKYEPEKIRLFVE